MKNIQAPHQRQEVSQEKIMILRDVFLNKKIPDPSIFYQGEGRELYNKISLSSAYWANKVEMDILTKHATTIAKYIGSNVTDIWCGNGEKAACLLRALQDRRQRTYIASDSSALMTELAEKNIIEQVPNIHIGNHQIMRPGNNLFTDTLADNTYLCLWFLLGDFDRPGMVKQLKNMSNRGITTGNDIILSYFEAPKNAAEIQHTLDLYKNQEGKDFILNGISNVWLDAWYFDHVVEYNQTNHCVYISIQVNKEYEIFVPERHILKKGEKYRIYQSRRFSHEEINSVLKEIHCAQKECFSQDGVSVLVARQTPKYGKRVLKITALTAGMLLWSLAIQQSMEVYNQAQKDKIIDKALEKRSNDMSMTTYFEMHADNLDSVQLKEYILGESKRFADIFVGVFGKGDMTEKEIQYSIMGSMSQERLKELGKDVTPFAKAYDFLLDNVIPDQEYSFLENRISLIPHKELISYEAIMKKSLASLGDTSIKTNDYDMWVIMWAKTYYKEIGKYVSSGGGTYELAITTDESVYPGVLIAKNIDEWGMIWQYEYALGRDIIRDYFVRKYYPTIKKRYDLVADACQFGKWVYEYEEKQKLLEYIIDYTIANPVLKTPYEDITTFLELYKDKFGKDTIASPYKNISLHAEAFHNAVKYWKSKTKEHDILVPTYKEMARYDIQFLGRYITQDQKSYLLAYITVEGKEYMLAQEENVAGEEYCIYDAVDVAEDFLSTRWNKK